MRDALLTFGALCRTVTETSEYGRHRSRSAALPQMWASALAREMERAPAHRG